MRNLSPLRPQDVLLLLQLLLEVGMGQTKLALKLDISQAEISMGFRRLKFAGLVNVEGVPSLEACEEYLIYALKYCFPAALGTMTAGMPTAHSKPGFNFVKPTNNEPYVWPDSNGKIRGLALEPIHKGFVHACKNDESLYNLACLVEMIRVGRARERELAANLLREIIQGKNGN